MFAPYVDGAAEPHVRAEVDAHLSRCPPCRERVAIERAAHEAVCGRRGLLRDCAPEHLRRRCAAQRGPAPARPRPFIRRTVVPVSLAASLLLVAAMLFMTFAPQVEVLAAQLAADHVKCFYMSSAAQPADATLLSREWASARGWSLKIPPGTPDHNLELLDVRRCGSTDGIVAHLMYRWRGSPLSVYVMNSESSRARAEAQFVETLGQEAVIWTGAGRTYAVVAEANKAELDPVVQYVRARAR
jgi:anti-sigma factor RsiW